MGKTSRKLEGVTYLLSQNSRNHDLFSRKLLERRGRGKWLLNGFHFLTAENLEGAIHFDS
jgi:hypothetical protein